MPGNTPYCTPQLRRHFEKRLKWMQKQAQELANRLPQDRQLSDTEKATFYSSWSYSAVRLSTSLPQLNQIEDIARTLNLSRQRTARIVQFLLSHGLCIREKDGRLSMGPQRIHIGSDSPFVVQHHRNWRQKAMERMDS